MNRLAHLIVAVAIALAAVAVPCRALLTTPELSPRKCCSGQHGMPAKSGCQSQCASSANPAVVPEFAIPVPAMLPAQTLELGAVPLAVRAENITAAIEASPPGCLYLRNSSLLI
jgi:hypothetical protein